MSKNALVIKGVSFSTNKLTTVEFVEEIPCTALSLSESSKTVTTITPFTLTATKTPANTTDTLYWASSDDTVVTVLDGVVTVVGVGTATITATCGNQTATCSVDATEVEPDVDYGAFQLGILSDVAVRASANLYRLILFDKDSYGTMLGFRMGDSIEACPIKLLKNTGRIKVTGSSFYADNAHMFFVDTTEAASETYSDCAKLKEDNTSQSTTASTFTLNYTVPQGANAVGLMMRVKTADVFSSNDPVVCKQFAENHNVKMTFLPALAE